jgi:DNA-binding transcriptional LysR family regulator
LNQLATELQIRKGYSVSKFQIAASSIPGEIILPPLCSEFLHHFPGTEIQIAISNSQNAIRQLMRGDVHLCAVGGLFDQDQEQIIRSFLGADEIKILARINHPILSDISAFGEKVSQKLLISELAKYPWIFREEGSATRRWFMENFPGARQFTVALEFQNNFAIINALERSNAITALSSHLIPGMISGRQIQVIENPLLPSIKREFYILRLKDQKLASAEQQFWDFLNTLKK